MMRAFLALILSATSASLLFTQEATLPRAMPVPKAMPLTDDPLLGKGPWLDAKEQAGIRALWPADVDWIDGLKFYKPTEYSQRSAIDFTFGYDRDSLAAVHKSRDEFGVINPNRLPQWAAPGGLNGLTGWKSYVGVSLLRGSKIKAWQGRVHTETSPRQGLPKKMWEFPDGSQFVDMLVNGDGSVFEMRVRTKRQRWVSSVPFKIDGKLAGYNGPGQSCASCHDDPGNAYGIAKRGGDTIHSAPILKEGTLDWDTVHWPLEVVHGGERTAEEDQPIRLLEPAQVFQGSQGVFGRRRFR